ncbi:response regulator [Crateriforma conspicua]|uniref:response regulator n=1 Tax=Crateriforma TaxID=2714592 RepID=UPI0011B4BF0B|nr:response regulator [Crateriforma conspicua]
MVSSPQISARHSSGPVAVVVDDNRVTRRLIRTLLHRLGIRSVTAPDGQAGLQTVQRIQPDLIVTDLEMPNMTGEELVQAVRCNVDPRIANLPIVVCSSCSETFVASAIGSLRTDAFVPKPIGNDDFRTAVHQAMNQDKGLE